MIPSPTARNWPLSVFTNAFIAAVVGFGGTIALIVSMGQHLGASATQIGSAVTALCLGIGIAGAALSIALRMPIVLAWSTPGAALIAGASGVAYGPAVGAFLFAAALMMLLGLVPALGRLAARIPPAIASAMLGGILLSFCIALFRSVEHSLLMALPALIVFIVIRQRWPTYALLAALLLVIATVLVRGQIGHVGGGLFGTLGATAPVLDAKALVSLGIPLFLVTLASQNLPGLAVMRSAGYDTPPRPVLLYTGLTTLLLAPFGAFSINLAAITAAICTGDDTHPDRARRWRAGVVYSGFYLLLALFSTPLVELFRQLPGDAIATIAGLALIAPLSGAMAGMLAAPREREAAVLCFLATASGLSLLGIGSAFWGLVVGFAVLGARRLLAR
ncbi:benzoate/H(+) symporter BenE family transporter [Solimonas marina]|uniref:Benzoate/H(+) symporter BenE family transporter n=1 Tax=Solimonas marina TaxID=2714601 RepID=A0A969WCB9_9GAMM|nr:benzoate/H(+) symporter BenE family transporter [Solimonas marina]NKF22230.1 benzoate/H(+) symporter BenE family transporter [Solimonas marina]